jgi:hypothetical protein
MTNEQMNQNDKGNNRKIVRDVLEISSTGYGLESVKEEKENKENNHNNPSCGGL